MGKRNFTVLELTLKLRYEWENMARNDLVKIMKSINRWAKRAKFGGKIVGMIVVTDETAKELMYRLRPILDEVTAVEDFWCQTVGGDATGRYGSMCPFQTAVNAAFEEARQRNHPKKVRDFRSRNIWLDHGVDYLNRKAAVKMGLRPKRERQA